jgi:hypothetical protein
MSPTGPPHLPSHDELSRWYTDGGANHDKPHDDPAFREEASFVADLLEDNDPPLPVNVALAQFEANVPDPVDRAEVLEVLDFIAGKLAGRPVASSRAATLAAAIRVRGLAATKGYPKRHG